MRIVVGVGGGIAAYKAAELVRALGQRGHDVQVVMTKPAQEFIQPLTFAALTGRKVITGLFSQDNSQDTLASAVEHIAVAKENELLVVAPARQPIYWQSSRAAWRTIFSRRYTWRSPGRSCCRRQ
jgi:phosphopantothenoylcysteine decarboxylase/phosphopantothenate--cysteine ligase